MALGGAALLAGCGGSGSASAGPRGAVSAFDAALSAHRYTAACALLGPIPQAVLIDADASAASPPSCAAALRSAGARRTLAHFEIPAARISRTRVSAGPDGTTMLQADHPEVTYSLTRQHGRWLIVEF